MNKKEFADIEWSKKLKDEFKDAEWWYREFYDGDNYIVSKQQKENIPPGLNPHHKHYPALTVMMLLERLPMHIKLKTLEGNPRAVLVIGKCVIYYKDKNKIGFHVSYRSSPGEKVAYEDESLPNALAKMLLWLKDEGLLKG